MNKCGLLEKFTRRKSVLSKESSTAPVASKQTIRLLEKHLWTDETMLEMFDCNARHCIWLKKKKKAAYQHKHIILTVKHGGEGEMI